MKRSFGLTLLAAALLALSACSGDSEPDASGTPTDGHTVTPGVELTDSEAFALALAGLESGSYRVVYQFTASAAGQDFDGTLTWVRADDGRARFETTAIQAGETVTLIVIADAEGGELLCMDLAGAGNCFDPETSPIVGSTPNPALLILEGIADKTRLSDVTRSGSETILGIAANCFRYEGADGATEACIGAQGFLLRAEWSAAGQSARLEAIKFSDDVSDEDFETPYPITG